MSIEAMNAVFARDDLPPYERLVMLALADRCDDEMTCFPSIPDICQRTGMGERGVQNVINRLEESGFLTVRRGGGRRSSNGYLLHIHPEKPRTPCPVSDDKPRTGCTVTDDKPRIPCPVYEPKTPHPVTETPHPIPKTPHPVPPNHQGTIKNHQNTVTTQTSKASKAERDAGFAAFWAVYPKKVAKPAARKNWDRAIRAGADPAAIIAGAERYAKSDGVARGFVKHPQGWLTDERWTDEQPTPQQIQKPTDDSDGRRAFLRRVGQAARTTA